MKHVSLNKIKPSVLIKVPGLFILGLLAVAFLLFPLAAFAGGCGGKKAHPPVAAKATFLMPMFGPTCGGSVAPSKNATVGSNTPDTKTVAPPTTDSSLLAAVAKCRFVALKPGQKPILQNGDIVLGQTAKGDDIIGIVVGTKLRLLVGDGSGAHAVAENVKLNIKLTNATFLTADGKVDSTPNDGNEDQKKIKPPAAS